MMKNISKLVEIVTNYGSFEIELYHKHCPRTCENFARLCKKGYYEKTLFYRKNKYIVQGGDPSRTVSGKMNKGGVFGGESVFGGLFEDETTDKLKHTGAGIICMANQGSPNTNGSQFFITLQPTPNLDGKNTIFGRVCKGIKVVKMISLVKTDMNEKPVKDIVVLKTVLKNE